jgi:enoyl-CoA hydratase/carnithine racemase
MDLRNLKLETRDGVAFLTVDRPQKLNAMNYETMADLERAFSHLGSDEGVRAVIVTGAGEKAFIAGADIQELARETTTTGHVTALRGQSVFRRIETLGKPVIAAINGFAMGGGFQLVERTDLRVAVRAAVFEISEAKRWLLGGYDHGFIAGLPHPIATEMALGFRFTADRMYELGFLNRVVEPEALMSTAQEMAAHLLTLPPAARVNTVYMMRQMRARVSPPLERLAKKLHEHGAKSDLMESRRAFAEKRKPNFKGWDDPADRQRLPTLE